MRTNPNEQAYWDGTDRARRRLWNAGSGWTETGAGSGLAPAGTLAVSGQRRSANPYAPHPTTTAPSVRPAPGVTIGLFIVVASSIAVMVGSVTTSITSSASFTGGSRFGGFAFSSSTTVSGVDQGMSTLRGINGYITLVGGTVVLVFAGLMAASDATSIRLVGSIAALASLGLSIYAVVRLVEKLDAAHTPHGVSLDVGWASSWSWAPRRWRRCSPSTSSARAASPADEAIRRTSAGSYCGGPDESCTVAVWVCPELSVQPIVTLSPGW